MSDPSAKAPESKEAAVIEVKPYVPSKVGAIAYGEITYRQWMMGKALEALLMRNGPYKEVAQHAVEAVDKVLKIMDAEPGSTVTKAG